MMTDYTGGDPLDPESFAGLALPAALQESLQRHRENLSRLILSLHSAGLGEAEIEASVSVIVASYRAELLHVLKSMAR